MSTEHTSSATAACSTVTCNNDRRPGSIVVSREFVEVHLAQTLQALENSLAWFGCSSRNPGTGQVVFQMDPFSLPTSVE